MYLSGVFYYWMLLKPVDAKMTLSHCAIIAEWEAKTTWFSIICQYFLWSTDLKVTLVLLPQLHIFLLSGGTVGGCRKRTHLFHSEISGILLICDVIITQVERTPFGKQLEELRGQIDSATQYLLNFVWSQK